MSVLSEFLDKLTPKERLKIAAHFGLKTNDAEVISTHLDNKLERLVCPDGPLEVSQWSELSLPIYGESYKGLRTTIAAMIVVGNATISRALRNKDILDRMASYFNRTTDEVVEMLRAINKNHYGNSRLSYMWNDELAPSKWPKKPLPKNNAFILPIFPLENLTRDKLKVFADEAPQYESVEFKRLVSNTIGAIHQIPRLLHRMDGVEYQLKNIEAYFGRSSGAKNHPCDNLYQRVYRAGFDIRHHEYGIIFARTTLEDCALYEHHGIRLFEILRETKSLCISNKSISSFGRSGSVEPGFLYMTFKILQKQEKLAHILTDRTIRELLEKEERGDKKHHLTKLSLSRQDSNVQMM
jgi:hypothetical protein